ncbi:MAG: hypothetical protein GXO75_17475 [Calditrichaeota bacterium]|nr:hypothetical protein [Calditrichota bacterium]
MTISKNVMLVNLFAFIFVTSCVPPPPLAQTHVVLTSDIIQTYHITENDLKNVQFFLDKKLVIIGDSTSLDKRMTKFHELKLYKNRIYDQVTFSKAAKGILVGTRLDGNLLQRFLKKEVLKLDITFEADTTSFLTFIPNASGGYELETLYSGKFVRYRNKQYKCLSGCSANALMVDAEFIQKLITNKRVVPGNELPY